MRARVRRTGTGFLVSLMMIGALTGVLSHEARAETGPTEASALAADEALAHAMRDNNSDAITALLDKDWAVVSTTGGVGEGPDIFPSGIRSNYLIRKTFEISEPRVRLFGDTAVVTAKVRLSGVFRGKAFDVAERQTDVWVWRNGGWKCVMTHETKLAN